MKVSIFASRQLLPLCLTLLAPSSGQSLNLSNSQAGGEIAGITTLLQFGNRGINLFTRILVVTQRIGHYQSTSDELLKDHSGDLQLGSYICSSGHYFLSVMITK